MPGTWLAMPLADLRCRLPDLRARVHIRVVFYFTKATGMVHCVAVQRQNEHNGTIGEASVGDRPAVVAKWNRLHFVPSEQAGRLSATV